MLQSWEENVKSSRLYRAEDWIIPSAPTKVASTWFIMEDKWGAGRQRWALFSTCSTANRHLTFFTFDNNGHLRMYSILICFCLIVHFSQTTALTLTSRMFAKVPQETCWTEMWRCVLLLLLPLSLPNVDTDSCKCYWLSLTCQQCLWYFTWPQSFLYRCAPNLREIERKTIRGNDRWWEHEGKKKIISMNNREQ